MARTDPQVNLRIPAELKSVLEAACTSSGRSLTAEIVTRLWMSFEDPEPRSPIESVPKVVLHVDIIGDEATKMRDIHEVMDAISKSKRPEVGLVFSTSLARPGNELLELVSTDANGPVIVDIATDRTRDMLKNVTSKKAFGT